MNKFVDDFFVSEAHWCFSFNSWFLMMCFHLRMFIFWFLTNWIASPLYAAGDSLFIYILNNKRFAIPAETTLDGK